MPYIDLTALALIAACSLPLLFFWRRSKKDVSPFIAYPDLKNLLKTNGRTRFAKLPKILLWGALFSFLGAFIDPHFLTRKTNLNSDQPPLTPSEGIAIYLILDQSGSMKGQVVANTATGQKFVSKIDLVKEVTKEFIQGEPRLKLAGRPNDLIGLVYFSRAAKVMSPLTLDHTALVKQLDKFQEIGDPSQDGTSIGYAIYKTANIMAATRHYAQELIDKGEPAYTIKSNIIILLTDGLQDPNPLDKGKRFRNMDVPEAAKYAKELGVRLYMVNVDPNLNTEEFAPYQHIMQRAAELTGGKFFAADNGKGLQEIYQAINKLEKSSLPITQEWLEKEKHPDFYQRQSLYPFLIALGLICLFSYILLDTVLLRRIP